MTSDDRRVWRKSSLSNNGGQSCVEVHFDNDTVYVRDSKYLRDPANDPQQQPIIGIPAANWPDFLGFATYRQPTTATGLPAITERPDGSTQLMAQDGTALEFTPAEWHAFVGGVLRGEFDEPTVAAFA
ncbi:DUF397 domain-containing protein [Nocardia wallacei]|uniref:DUF397 domain-containing protein n=1 Tax=Nocardia wallacei TaxID=480035 RepID=UPI002455E5AC|nr:DUF397 domain-containing protein [Nocardia wallacei]